MPWRSHTFYALVCALFVTACEEEARPSDAAADRGRAEDAVCDPRWACAEGWVPSVSGGCGPAVILCDRDGGAAAGACDLAAIRAPSRFTAEDGGVGWRFGLQPDGAITGGWGEQMPACGEGWRRLDDGSCVPTYAMCPAGASALPDGRCTATTTAQCPAERFPARTMEMMGRTVVYADAEADPMGADGSEAHPFPELATAVSRAGDGGFVLLGAGRYARPLELTTRTTLVGPCAARVTLGEGGGIVVRARARAALRALTVHGGALFAAGLDAREVTFRGGDGRFALRVEGSNQSALDDVRVEMGDGDGVHVVQGATASLRRFAVEGAGGVGIFLFDAGVADLQDGVVRDVRRDAVGTTNSGIGLAVHSGSHVTAERIALERNQVFAVHVTGGGSSLTLRGGVIRDTRPVEGGAGKAIQSDEGASATLDGVLLSGNHNTAGSAFNGGTLVVRDSVVVDTHERPDGTAGRGLDAHHVATLHVARTRIEGMHDVALFSFNGSTVTARDVLIRRTELPAAGGYGVGLTVVSLLSALPTTLDARRVVIEDSTEIGFAAVGPGARATLDDVIVRGVRPSPRGFAIGALTTGGANLAASRLAVVGARGIGVGTQQYVLDGVVGGTRAVVHDLFVRDVTEGQILYNTTDPRHPMTGRAAYGITFGEGATFEVERAVVDGAQTGMAALGPATVRRVVVSRAGRDGVLGVSRVRPDAVRMEGDPCGGRGPFRMEEDLTLGDVQVPFAAQRSREVTDAGR